MSNEEQGSLLALECAAAFDAMAAQLARILGDDRPRDEAGPPAVPRLRLVGDNNDDEHRRAVAA